MIKCEYCSVVSVELKSKCDWCGAPLPLMDAPARKPEPDPWFWIDAPPSARLSDLVVRRDGHTFLQSLILGAAGAVSGIPYVKAGR